MKNAGLFFILMIAGFILVTGCVLKPTDNGVPVTGAGPSGTIKNPVFGDHLQNLPFGQLNISIGNYDARLSVSVDGIDAGIVSAGKPLNLRIVEGDHVIRICAGTVCESVKVDILSGTTTTIDLEERIRKDIPMGTLNVSIGDYFAILPVWVDNAKSGNVSIDKPFVQDISPGQHTVKICNLDDCYTKTVDVVPWNETVVDFQTELVSGVNQAELTITIGGYKGEQLPFYIDNTSAGFISQGSPVTVKIDTGVHEVKVCSGAVCVAEQVTVRFARPNNVDLGEQLKQKAAFTKPTVLITEHYVSGENLNINAEFINPSTKDLTMTATFAAQYTYINSHHERVGSSTSRQVTTFVRAGGRSTQSLSLWLSGGSDTIASDPVITNITMT